MMRLAAARRVPVALILFGVILLTFGFLAEMMTIMDYEDREPYHVERVLD